METGGVAFALPLVAAPQTEEAIEPEPELVGSSYSTGFNRGPQATTATVPATNSIRERNVRVTLRLLGGHGLPRQHGPWPFGYLEPKLPCKGFVHPRTLERPISRFLGNSSALASGDIGILNRWQALPPLLSKDSGRQSKVS